MRKENYTFNVPKFGQFEIVAKDLPEALMNLADTLGITIVRASSRPVPRLVRVQKSVSHR